MMGLAPLQGTWLGFRAAAAEDRFLQARRRGAGRLGFSNANLGTWEQWELVAGDPTPPWARLRLSLRSRRLPQVGAVHQLKDMFIAALQRALCRNCLNAMLHVLTTFQWLVRSPFDPSSSAAAPGGSHAVCSGILALP